MACYQLDNKILFIDVAFLVALFQNKQLIGRNGLLPGDLYLEQIKSQIKDQTIAAKVAAVPTLFWLVEAKNFDAS